MPPKKPKNLGRSVKEMLQKKQETNKKQQNLIETDPGSNSEEDSIILPKIFSQFTDIGAAEITKENYLGDVSYSCSTMAKVWFKTHSNLDEILDKLMEKVKSTNHPKEAYVSTAIRAVTSTPVRKLQRIYSDFHFDSPVNEIIGRTLLTNPQIKSQEDLETFLKFQNKHKLQLCEVSLYKNNLVHEDAKDYVQQQRIKQKRPDVPVLIKQRFEAHLQRKHFERHDQVLAVFLRDLTVEQMEEISNFKRIVLKDMRNENRPESHYPAYAKLILGFFKTSPEVRLGFDEFKVHPRFTLVCNNLTLEQEREFAADKDNFYGKTNAERIFRHFGGGMTKEEFHERYRCRTDEGRKLPPFHDLYVKKEFRDLPATSRLSTSLRERCVSNSPPRLVIDLEDESDESMDTVVRSQTPAEVKNEDEIPQKFLENPNVKGDFLKLARILLTQPGFVNYVKLSLNDKYKKNFDESWKKSKKFIMMNFIKGYWSGQMKVRELLDSTQRCSAAAKKKVEELVEKRERELAEGINGNEENPPVFLVPDPLYDPPQTSPNEPATEESPEIIQVTPGNGETPPVTVKVEKITQEMSYSEVECLGTVQDKVIEINDSQDADSSLIASLQAEEDSRNPFLKEINEAANSQTPNSTLKRFRAFEATTTRCLRDDLEQAKAKPSKKRSPANKPGPKCKKKPPASTSRAQNLEYIDDDSESPPKGNENEIAATKVTHLANVLNDDFSVFLSSQLTEEKENDKTPPQVTLNPFTFVKAATSFNRNSLPTTESTCFMIQMQRVVFEKGIRFEIHVNLQQYTLYNIVVKGDSIRAMLNINDTEFTSLLNLLDMAERYEFEIGHSRRHPDGNNYITQYLDLFFSSLSNFKTFQLYVNGENFTCSFGSLPASSNHDLTSAIDSDVLRNMKSTR